MLFTRDFKEGIRAGAITRTYRTWKKPQAKVGGRYNLPPDGIIEVTELREVTLAEVSDSDARKAGYASQAALHDFLNADHAYQIDFRFIGAGLVRQPERHRLNETDLADMRERLARMDRRSELSWTTRVLELIGNNTGARAGDLAPALDWPTPRFKSQVRKLKALGLTESLEVGYRLSPRGIQMLDLLLRPGP